MNEIVINQGSEGSWPEYVIVFTDGASRGNPGPASVGVHIQDEEGSLVHEYAEVLGDQTNNYAEYMAVIKALELASNNNIKKLKLCSDSQLLIRQLLGEYKVKSETLKPLFTECKSLAAKIPSIQYEHVRREFNKRADELANIALDSV